MAFELNRRQILKGSVGLAAATGCARKPKAGAEPPVSILKADYGPGLHDKVRRLLLDHKLDVRGKRVLLKPNLVEFDPGAAINTNPLLVLAAFEAFRSLGAANVGIAEGPGHRRVTLDLADAAGYYRTFPDFDKVFTDLNLDEVAPVRLPRAAGRLDSLYLPKTALGCDLLVSLPKMKTHHWVGATLGMKNLFGLVPGGVYGWPKNVLHWAGIDESIVAINSAFPRLFTVVDGIEGMEGNGPIQGRPKLAGVIVGGPDRVAVDATCCRIMGIDPQKIRYLRLAETSGQTEAVNVRQIGESILAVATPFELLPSLRGLRLTV
jgi:uncharacterized protein (DUF362 family)